MNLLARLSHHLLPYLLATTLATVLSACGSDSGQADTQGTGTSTSLSKTSANDPLDASIDKTQMLKDLNAFFKEAALSQEDQQQIKAARLREATQGGRLPNYMAGETLASPAVVASAGIKAQSGITVSPQANFLYSTPVYRFYNLFTNVHFYTASEAERNTVVNTAPHFRDEGIGFFASNNAAEPNTAPVYRFYNYSTGAHFYTISQSERDTVINSFSQYYRFEGIAWYANPNPDTDLTPMYRFYNFNVGAHFYTTSSSERAYVIANFPFMRDEGIAYYVAASRSYTIGGTASGLGSGKTVVLTLNGGADLSVSSNSSFTFGTALTSAQTYTVAIKTQPVAQSCSVTNGSGTIGSASISNITVTCTDLNALTVGGTLTGLTSGISVVLSLNGGNDLTLTTNGAFNFAATIPSGQTFTVLVKTQPIGQTCTVVNGSGTLVASTTNVGINCVINTPAGLLISEVSSCPTDACWFEVLNPTTSTLNLSSYNLQSSSKNSAGTNTTHTFALPSLSIAPNAYAIVMGNPGNSVLPLNPQTALAYDAGFYPSWTANGFIELISVNTGATVDFVKFGTNSQTPTTSTHWVGAQVAALSSSIYGNAIVRSASTIGTQDSNSASDWISVTFATPAGQNDVPSGAVDSDGDGIPDSSELPGSTYAGMDLYSMGARQGVRDIFIEVDHMNSTDPGIIPRIEALQKMVDAFAVKGIAVHFDAGTQFSAAFSPANFNLGQGNNTVTYEQCVDFTRGICTSNVSQLRSVYDWKLANFELRRKNIFHYMLFGSSQLVGGGSGSSGRAEIVGNDSIITLGGWGLTTSPDANKLINYQAGTIMHEFGHNLGLFHGGNEDVNYKPNYYSVMNYLYQLNGLSSSASSIGPYQRWLFDTTAGSAIGRCSILNSPCSNPSQFIIDYSNGSSTSLNETALLESANIGRGADVGVYADWDRNGTQNTSTYALDINKTSPNSTLTDYNDWANLNLPFFRYSTANNGINPNIMSTVQTTPFDPMSNDRQPVSDCTPNPLWLRLAMQAR